MTCETKFAPRSENGRRRQQRQKILEERCGSNPTGSSQSVMTPLVAGNLARVYQEGMSRSAIGVRIIGHLKSTAQQLSHAPVPCTRGSFAGPLGLETLIELTLDTTNSPAVVTTSSFGMTPSPEGKQ